MIPMNRIGEIVPQQQGSGDNEGIQHGMLQSEERPSLVARLLAAIPDLAPSAVMFGLAMLGRVVEPYQRDPSEYREGPAIDLPNDRELIPTGVAIVYSYVIPLAVIALLSLASKSHDLEAAIGLFETAAFNEFYTTYLKKIAGALRPSFLAMCEWDGTACQASGSRSKSSRQSFPSGHSSNAFAGMVYLMLVVHLYLSHVRKHHAQWCPPSMVRWMASLPLLVAGWIAVSRTRDHHHRWVDISAGAGIGAAAALATFAARVPAMRASLEGARKGVPQ